MDKTRVKYQLTAVSFLDRWITNVRFFLFFLALFALALALQLALFEAPSDRSVAGWMIVLAAIFCLFTFSARGPINTGYLEIDQTKIVMQHNDMREEIAVSTIAHATLVNIVGNRMILMKVGSEKHDWIYSHYSISASDAFRSALGLKLRQGNLLDYLKHVVA